MSESKPVIVQSYHRPAEAAVNAQTAAVRWATVYPGAKGVLYLHLLADAIAQLQAVAPATATIQLTYDSDGPVVYAHWITPA